MRMSSPTNGHTRAPIYENERAFVVTTNWIDDFETVRRIMETRYQRHCSDIRSSKGVIDWTPLPNIIWSLMGMYALNYIWSFHYF